MDSRYVLRTLVTDRHLECKTLFFLGTFVTPSFGSFLLSVAIRCCIKCSYSRSLSSPGNSGACASSY